MSLRTSLFGQAILYKYRYFIWYGLLIALLIFVATVDLGTVPNGINQAEMNQAVASSATRVSIDFGWTINGIYNLAQYISINVFGLNRFALVLPSVLFGTLTIVLFALMMRHWFRNSVAVVSVSIIATSASFVGMIRSATPEIMIPFWLSLLLFASMRLLVKREKAFSWELVILLAGIGLLYTPLGIYPLVAIFASALLHPHVRSRFRRISKPKLLTLSITAFACIAPLIINLTIHPQTIVTLTGADVIKDSLSNIKESAAVIYDMYFNVIKNGFSGTFIVPMFNLASAGLILLGFFRSFQERYTARSYVLLTWSLTTLLVVFFIPTARSLIFLPASMLAAIGIETMIIEWYKLFPRNPYARVAGLIPLSMLFIVIAIGNLSHYFNNFNHITNPNYNQSVSAIQQTLKAEGDRAAMLVTNPDEAAFYSILTKQHRYLTLTTTLPEKPQIPTLVLPSVEKQYTGLPSQIITSADINDAVLLRVYRPQ